MVSTYTPNINLEEPARGDQVGTWDTPVNNNMTELDLNVGGAVSITLNNSPVVLASAQYQSRLITFASTLTGSVTITFPSTFKKDYIIRHTCTGSSAFTITLQTTVAGGQVIACRPGNAFQCYNDGTNLTFVNLGTEIGGYWDYAGSSVPAWVSACTVPPYLYCNGQTFSATTYPQLAVILASTTVPDFRGRSAHYLNDGTGRLTSAGAGIDGNTIFASGGSNGVTLGTSHIPTHTSSGSNTITVYANGSSANHVPYTTGTWSQNGPSGTSGGAVVFPTPSNSSVLDTNSFSASNGISVSFTNSSQQGIPATAPGVVSGLRLIRAA